jgi:hypothetical protein
MVAMKDKVRSRANDELATLGEFADAGRVHFAHFPDSAMAMDRYRAYLDPPRDASGNLAEDWKYSTYYPIGKLAYQSRTGQAVTV